MTCCTHFGAGMADLVPGSRIGENPTVSGQYLDPSAIRVTENSSVKKRGS